MIIIFWASKYVPMLAVACDSDCVNGISERDKSERFREDDDLVVREGKGKVLYLVLSLIMGTSSSDQ